MLDDFTIRGQTGSDWIIERTGRGSLVFFACVIALVLLALMAFNGSSLGTSMENPDILGPILLLLAFVLGIVGISLKDRIRYMRSDSMFEISVEHIKWMHIRNGKEVVLPMSSFTKVRFTSTSSESPKGSRDPVKLVVTCNGVPTEFNDVWHLNATDLERVYQDLSRRLDMD